MPSFLSLPAELREQIYRLAFAGNRWNATEPEHPNYHWSTSSFVRFRCRLENSFRQPALAATCRLVRQESLPVFYSMHHCEFEGRISTLFDEKGLAMSGAGRTIVEWRRWWEERYCELAG